MDFLDLFLEKSVPCRKRARAFLWLVYHYLEDPMSSLPGPGAFDTNLFADDHSRSNPGRVPHLPKLTPEQMRNLGENVDLKEELELGVKMCNQRSSFLQRYARSNEPGRISGSGSRGVSIRTQGILVAHP